MNLLERVQEHLKQTNSFNINNYSSEDCNLYCEDCSYDDTICIFTYDNYLLIEPLTAEAERKLKMNPYNRLLKSKNHLYCLFYFPSAVRSDADIDILPPKYQTRYRNLITALNNESVRLLYALELPVKEILKLEYIAEPYDKSKQDFKDDEADTTCTSLAQPEKPYQEITRISLTYNTILILNNAKENGNNALIRYRGNTTAFYTDFILNYLLEHAGLLQPENFKYSGTKYVIHIPFKELRKLYPHGSFKLKLPEGVTLEYEQAQHRVNRNNPPKSNRISKNDTAIFTFSDDFMAQYKAIIMREASNVEAPNSFLKFPIGFLLQALKQENLTANGFNFLLWLLPFFRMKSPKVFHSTIKILDEIGADLSHGYNKPLEMLQRYFNYLQRIGMIKNAPAPIKLVKACIDEPPEYNGAMLQLTKPAKPKKEQAEEET